MANKIRSIELYQYLLHKGVLGAADEVINDCKRQYRKEYKRNWKRNRLKQKPELRPNFTKTELQAIVKAATAKGVTNTDFVRQAALSEARKTEFIANRDALLTILQKVSMAGILVANKGTTLVYGTELIEADTLLRESETLLMQYLGYDN